MKIQLRIEEKGKFIQIPFSKDELRTLYDLCYFPSNNGIKQNKLNIPYKKMQFLIHDIIDKGICYKLIDKKIKNKHVRYLIKKPKWERIRK